VPKLAARSPFFGVLQEADDSGLAVGLANAKIYSSPDQLTAERPSAAGAALARPSVVSGPEKAHHSGPAGLDAPVGGLGSEGGEASAGGARLERQGLAIIADYPLEAVAKPQADSSAASVPPVSSDLFAIDGALARRRILKMNLPRYPRWAEEKGIEAQVSVRLAATVQGEIVPDLYILRTSGYPELDQLVLDAVKSIVFAPEPESNAGHQDSGVVTFNFKLRRNLRGLP
jgi:TonB family protein